MNKLLLKLLSLLGFVSVAESCDLINGNGESPAMYGTPHANFKIIGTVKDSETYNPINNIRVTLLSKDSLVFRDTTYTDNDGCFKFELKDRFPINSAEIKAVDIDGEKNGGDYQTGVRSVNFEFKGGDEWYAGSSSSEIDITLSKK